MKNKEEQNTEPKKEDNLDLRKNLYRNSDFLEFLMNRPYYKVKNKVKSEKFRYIGPTITRANV